MQFIPLMRVRDVLARIFTYNVVIKKYAAERFIKIIEPAYRWKIKFFDGRTYYMNKVDEFRLLLLANVFTYKFTAMLHYGFSKFD